MSAPASRFADTSSFTEFARTQGRVLLALILREAKSRYGRSTIGYLWALLEPMVIVGLLALVYIFLDRKAPLGDQPAVFLMTGYMPFMLFQHLSVQMASAIRSNKSLLYFPIISNVDVILSRAILEIVTKLWVMILLFGAVHLAGYQAMPHNMLDAFAAIGTIALLGTGAGFCNAIITTQLAFWPRIVAWSGRALFFTSGIFFLPSSLPHVAQEYLQYLPLLQAIDWFRTAFFFGYNSNLANKPLLFGLGLWLLFCGLAMERMFRRRINEK